MCLDLHCRFSGSSRMKPLLDHVSDSNGFIRLSNFHSRTNFPCFLLVTVSISITNFANPEMTTADRTKSKGNAWTENCTLLGLSFDNRQIWGELRSNQNQFESSSKQFFTSPSRQVANDSAASRSAKSPASLATDPVTLTDCTTRQVGMRSNA